MAGVSWAVIIVLLLYIAFIVFLIRLQIKLSQAKEKWKGLLMPVVFFVFSVMMVLGSASFYQTSITSQIFDEEGKITYEHKETTGGKLSLGAALSTLPIFVLGNIPTGVFLAIYFVQRSKLKPQEEINRMNIQDL